MSLGVYQVLGAIAVTCAAIVVSSNLNSQLSISANCGGTSQKLQLDPFQIDGNSSIPVMPQNFAQPGIIKLEREGMTIPNCKLNYSPNAQQKQQVRESKNLHYGEL